MNMIKDLHHNLSVVILSKIQDLYQYRPSMYDIAIGVFRTTLAGLLTKPLLSLVKDDKSATSLCRVAFIIGVLFWAYIEFSSLIRWCKVYKISKDQSKKDVVIICRAKFDFNGAANRLSSQQLEIIQNLAQTHSLVLLKANTVKDINAEIDRIVQQGRNIKKLWLTAHGNTNKIALGDDNIIGEFPIYTIKDTLRAFFGSKVQNVSVSKINLSKLDPKADIILSSCCVGGNTGVVGSLNIAEWFQVYAGKDKRVYAPRALLPSNGTKQTIASNGVANYHFTGLLGTDITSDISYSKATAKFAHSFGF